MVRLSIPRDYSISHRYADWAVVRSPDQELCLWLTRYHPGEGGRSEADFLDRFLAEVGEELSGLRRWEIEPVERVLNGMPMLQVAIAAYSLSLGGEAQGGLFMIDATTYVLVVLVLVRADCFGRKRSELSQFFASIRPD